MTPWNRAVGAALLATAVAATLMIAPGPAAAQSGKRTPRADWTFMVYDTADTEGIEQDLIADIESLAKVGSSDNVNVVALVDRAPGQFDGPMVNIPDFDTTKLVKIERGRVDEIEDYGEVDMGDGQTLSWFVYTMMVQYPAEHYALTIDNHGGGKDGASWDDSTPPDADGLASNLGLREITDAIAGALASADEDKLDVLNYAACLMAHYDAASLAAPYVDYLLASEEVTVGLQADMSDMVRSLQQQPDNVPAAMQTLIDLTEQVAERPDLTWVTMSLIDLRAFRLVDEAVTSFAAALSDEIENIGPLIGRAQSDTLHFGLVGSAEDHYQLYDLRDLLAHLPSISREVDTAVKALYTAISGVIVSEGHGPTAEAATGLSLYFPATADGLDDEYGAIAANPTWSAFLDEYFEHAGAVSSTQGSDAPNFSTDLELSPESDGILATGGLDPTTARSAIEARAIWGVVDGDTINYLLAMPAELDSGTVGTVSAGWDLSYFELTDGDVTLPATTHLEPTAGGVRASIPALYQFIDGSQADAVIQIDFTNDGASTAQIVLIDEDGSSATMFPDRGDIIAPLVLQGGLGAAPSYQLASDQALDATALDVNLAAVPGGTRIVAIFVVTDAAGNEAVASGSAQT